MLLLLVPVVGAEVTVEIMVVLVLSSAVVFDRFAIVVGIAARLDKSERRSVAGFETTWLKQ